MANNRMFLLHKPSFLGVMLGKELGDAWYKPPEKDELQRFYDYVFEMHGDLGGFILIAESSPSWSYTSEFENGFRVFKMA